MSDWSTYHTGAFHDELIGPDGQPRAATGTLAAHLAALSPRMLKTRQDAAERAITEM